MNHTTAVGGDHQVAAMVGRPPRPLVWSGGVPLPELAVVSLAEEAPLAERRVELAWPTGATPPSGPVRVAEPLPLRGGGVVWRTLAVGSIAATGRARRAGETRDRGTLTDRWAARLADAVEAPWSERDGVLVHVAAPRLGVGRRANRSSRRWPIRGRSVYVPTTGGGEAWGLLDAIEFLAAAVDLPWSWTLVATRLGHHPLTHEASLSGTIAEVCGGLLTPQGLKLRRPAGGSADDDPVLELVDAGTSPLAALPEVATSRLALIARDAREDAAPATRWIAEGGRNAVEATLPLVADWDASRQDADDAAYDRVRSDDFAAYRDVFRRWVLNEDAALPSPPDLAALLESPAWSPTPLRLGETLTLDGSGRPRPPVVEASVDGGATWSPMAGRVQPLEGRAGVYLDEDAPAASWLAAVRAGAARVRVTATLVDPRPLRVERWGGNPFAGRGRDRRVDAGAAFERLRVDAGGVFADHAGPVERDDRDALAAWLDGFIDRTRRREGRRTVARYGGLPLTSVHAGDRVVVPGRGAEPPRVSDVVRVEHRFAADVAPGSTLELVS